MNRFERRLEVDECRRPEVERELASPDEHLRPDDATDLREEGGERRVRRGRLLVRPERLDQLGARDLAEPVADEVDEEHLALASRQLALDPAVAERRHDPPADLDARQDLPKVEASVARDNPGMAKILIHITRGPEDPSRAALGFLVGRSAVEQGHEVSLFLAADGVQLLRDAVLDNLTGLGTGVLRESYDALASGGARFYLSGGSSAGRGVTAADLEGKPAELAQPSRLVRSCSSTSWTSREG